jgi:hypothetical protein
MCIDSEPTTLTGSKVSAGKIIMGKMNDGTRTSFDIESC